MNSVVSYLNVFLGIFFLLVGFGMSSSLYPRVKALSWPLVDAAVTNIEWGGGESPKGASASISFRVSEGKEIFSDRVFDRPWVATRSNVLARMRKIEAAYRVGSVIQVRFDGKKALLQGFPESYANMGLLQLIGGLGFAVAGGLPLYKKFKSSSSGA